MEKDLKALSLRLNFFSKRLLSTKSTIKDNQQLSDTLQTFTVNIY